jgi:glutamate-ammonia-ligase adenylyltransferase
MAVRSDPPWLAGPWPLPADVEAAARLAERFSEIGRAEAALARRARRMLAAIGGNSPFLSELAVREARAVRDYAARGPAHVVDAALATIAETRPEAAREKIAAVLRAAKRRVALATALADVGGAWRLAEVTDALSRLAEAALRLSVAHLLRAAHDRGELVLPNVENPARGSGFFVLGMGKLGARELNYSSDVDLILLYDPNLAANGPGSDGIGGTASRFARGLVALMEARDADGYVFRTDLRLRPDPAATPPAMSATAALTYYEGMAHNWERAAMLKARPVAGDLEAGDAFLLALRPFVWRHGLDFAAVADIAAMKRRIDAHKRSSEAGFDVKLGRGGIREIEFLTQGLQLVWGGRVPALRDPTTLGALRRLAEACHLSARAAGELRAAYRFLRRVEHRLQMVADRQTHALPTRAEELSAFATFMGFADSASFEIVLARHLSRVAARYEEVFQDAPAEPGPALDFCADPEGAADALRSLGYGAPERVAAAVGRWRGGQVRALRSERARALLDEVLPFLLAALAREPDPDLAFSRFDAFLSAQPAGVQLLSLFRRNPGLLDRVAAVLGAAAPLAEHLARHPGALDGLLTPGPAPHPRRLLADRLVSARGLEAAVTVIRRTVREEDFSLSVATLDGELGADAAGIARAKLADAALAELLPRVLDDVASRHGRVRGGRMVVVALGKLGGREMMAGSDLDLMLIYDHPEDAGPSDGPRGLPASQYYVRAAQALVAATTAPGADGPLYDVDMRLRPSGRKGPIAVSLAGFVRYHAESAWTWERMALTRARVVAGPASLARATEAAIVEALAHPGGPAEVRRDAAAMRGRMLREHPAAGRWDVKHRAGGQIEVEFVAQTLQLASAGAVRSSTTRKALRRLAEAGVLPGAEARALIRADLAWRTVQGMLRITVGGAPRPELPEAAVRPLLRAASAAGLSAVDLDGLSADLDDVAREVRESFVRHVGEIG